MSIGKFIWISDGDGGMLMLGITEEDFEAYEKKIAAKSLDNEKETIADIPDSKV